MNNKFITTSNLPQSDVNTVIVSSFDKSLIKALKDLNINVLTIDKRDDMDEFISTHTDALVNYLGNGNIVVDDKQTNLINNLSNLNFNITLCNNIFSPYPNDSVLNACCIGDYIICNKNLTDKNILNYQGYKDKIFIDVKQGYSKCSICLLDWNTFITDDESIFDKSSCYNNINVIKVKKGNIKLNGLEYGFIGGCSGLIGKKKIFFNGDLELHDDYNKIKNFLDKYNIKAYYIKNKNLNDVGSIIPVLERT